MLDSFYHMTLHLLLNHILLPEKAIFPQIYCCYGCHSIKRKPLVFYQFIHSQNKTRGPKVLKRSPATES